MKLYLNENVYDAAKNRIRRLFDEFEVVVVNVSGGKDSTVVANLTLEVAEELGRLPVPVIFLDQEAEWDATIDYMRTIMHDPRVQPFWLQMFLRLSNATSESDDWLYCWEEGAEWIREKEPDSIHENIVGTISFLDMFSAVTNTYWGERSLAQLTGVRAEESPGRMAGLTQYQTYKDITWGKKHDNNTLHFTFHPLYDWSYTDIWKAIHENGWPYNRLYDYMFQYGIPTPKMRVSNVHHETAIDALRYLQEIEPENWDRIVGRLQGVNTVKHHMDLFRPPKELPWMFTSWKEYRDYLLDNLIQDKEKHAIFRHQFAIEEDKYLPEAMLALYKTEIAAILVNDYHGVKLGTFHAAYAKYRRSSNDPNKPKRWADRAPAPRPDQGASLGPNESQPVGAIPGASG